MIIYGSKAVHLNSTLSKTATCPSCETKGSILISIYRKHAHIFWIPLFPLGKRGISQCQHCKNALEPREMPEELKREYQNIKAETRGPIWQFAGLIIIALLFAWGTYSSSQNKKLELEYITTPAKGDLYKYKTESGSYSTFKIIETSTDSVFISANEYETDKLSGVKKIDIPENYSSATYGLSKVELKNMYDAGDIIDIKR